MSRFRYVGTEPRQVSILPSGRLQKVEPDELFDVPDDHAASYECQPDLYKPETSRAKGKG